MCLCVNKCNVLLEVGGGQGEVHIGAYTLVAIFIHRLANLGVMLFDLKEEAVHESEGGGLKIVLNHGDIDVRADPCCEPHLNFAWCKGLELFRGAWDAAPSRFPKKEDVFCGELIESAAEEGLQFLLCPLQRVHRICREL
jgi:hypothetical protein